MRAFQRSPLRDVSDRTSLLPAKLQSSAYVKRPVRGAVSALVRGRSRFLVPPILGGIDLIPRSSNRKTFSYGSRQRSSSHSPVPGRYARRRRWAGRSARVNGSYGRTARRGVEGKERQVRKEQVERKVFFFVSGVVAQGLGAKATRSSAQAG